MPTGVAVYGVPSAKPLFAMTPFRRAILALNPVHFWPCDDAYTLATDYGSVPQNIDTSVGGGVFGCGPLLSGEKHSVGVSGTGVRTAATLSFPSQFTYGVFVSVYGIGSENVYMGAWNGAGTMIYSSTTTLRAYMGGSSVTSGTAISTGRHLLVATYNGDLSLYLDGSLVAGPTTLASSATSTSLGINVYSGAAKNLRAQATDLFITSSAASAGTVAQLYSLSGG